MTNIYFVVVAKTKTDSKNWRNDILNKVFNKNKQ